MIVRLGSGVPLAFVLAAVAAANGACSSDDAATQSSSSGNASSGNASSSSGAAATIPKDECTTRCKAKLDECGAPASVIDQGCDDTCSGGVTDAQASCLEAADCKDLDKLQGGTLDDLCPKASGTTSSSSSSGSTSSGDPPAELTITGTIPSDYRAIHTQTGNDIASLFNVAPKPTFDPDFGINPAKVPELDKATSVTLESPDRPDGACGTSKFGLLVNSTQISVQIAGSDTLPDTACAKFTDALVDGAKLTLKGVPWPNSSVKSTVTIVLK